jgi:FkbM family methyltransferase
MITLPISYTLFLARLIIRPMLFVRKLLGLPVVVRCQRRSINYELDLTEGIDSSIYLKGDFEKVVRNAIEKYTKEGDIVLDIGANVGGHTLDFGKCVGASGRVYAFEPTAWAYQKLLINIKLNPNFSIYPLQIGLTDANHTPLPELLSSSWSLTKNQKEASPLDFGFGKSIQGSVQLSLDEWVLANYIEKVDVIKIDVDGHELKVLRGAVQTLRRFRPILIVEFAPHHFVKSDEKFVDMVQILIDLNYELETLNGIKLQNSAELIEKSIPKEVLLYVIAKPKTYSFSQK